jgi:hypothetical protein
MELRLLCLALLVGAAACAWTPDTFPNPERDVASCGRRGVRSWVCDPDGVISYQSANVIEGLIKKIVMGEAPYARDACGAGVEGYQVRAPAPAAAHARAAAPAAAAGQPRRGALCPRLPPPSPLPQRWRWR